YLGTNISVPAIRLSQFQSNGFSHSGWRRQINQVILNALGSCCKPTTSAMTGTTVLQYVPARVPPTTAKNVSSSILLEGIQKQMQNKPHVNVDKVAIFKRPNVSEARPVNGQPTICPAFSRSL